MGKQLRTNLNVIIFIVLKLIGELMKAGLEEGYLFLEQVAF